MPKINGTKKQRAVELLNRLKQGPSFFPIIGKEQQLTQDEFEQGYKRWFNSWILEDIQELIPELKKLKEKKDMGPGPVTNPKPEWLQKSVGGMTTSDKYMVYLEGSRFAVVVINGHTGYVDRMTGSKYSPTTYSIVKKGVNFWNWSMKEIHKGKASAADKERMQKILTEYEQNEKS